MMVGLMGIQLPWPKRCTGKIESCMISIKIINLSPPCEVEGTYVYVCREISGAGSGVYNHFTLKMSDLLYNKLKMSRRRMPDDWVFARTLESTLSLGTPKFCCTKGRAENGNLLYPYFS